MKTLKNIIKTTAIILLCIGILHTICTYLFWILENMYRENITFYEMIKNQIDFLSQFKIY